MVVFVAIKKIDQNYITKLVCLGDSIIAKDRDPSGILKLTPRLEKELPNWIIINAGVGGDNTKNALS